MKIYIKDYNIKTVASKLPLFKKYNKSITEYMEIYSTEGIFLIDNSQFLRLNYLDCQIQTINNYYKNFSLLIDPTTIILEKIHQLPTEHIVVPVTKQIFYIDNQSPIKLIYETTSGNTSHDIIPYNFYFELNNNIDINNELIKKELIVFLSLFN